LKPITTKRLNLRILKLADAKFILELVNSPTWKKHIGERNINDIPAAEKYINNLILIQKKYGFSLWLFEEKETKKPLGICGFLQRDYLPKPDLGFAILPQHEKIGFTTEAANACLNYGKEKLDFKKVYAITRPENIASQRLLEKLGFKPVSIPTPPKETFDLQVFEIGE